ncbi:hypothetical protein Skr01_23440 [Sphaerisporangium krabiense]|nr:hypothetical protein Skr01_23440 [Sphaerisporangium krabiense]
MISHCGQLHAQRLRHGGLASRFRSPKSVAKTLKRVINNDNGFIAIRGKDGTARGGGDARGRGDGR